MEARVEAPSEDARVSGAGPERRHRDFAVEVGFTHTLRMNCRSFSGGNVGGVPPVPIPNTEVKPSRADGTPRETARESRSLPDFFS